MQVGCQKRILSPTPPSRSKSRIPFSIGYRSLKTENISITRDSPPEECEEFSAREKIFPILFFLVLRESIPGDIPRDSLIKTGPVSFGFIWPGMPTPLRRELG
ncbi:hypothetical protein CDAR_183911 [Caerostris darwini]|uniref:Uncharacterized protein n=1 Tax=Caerostris darwini TaxID=1538125 RepID=A0AAV4TYC5_9ARAC|nr:hypothetical protein CDAR_183911 [Caerostris darwini]